MGRVWVHGNHLYVGCNVCVGLFCTMQTQMKDKRILHKIEVSCVSERLELILYLLKL